MRWHVATLHPTSDTIAWLTELRIDVNEIAPQAVVSQDADGYHLHVSRFVRDRIGAIVFDYARDEAVTTPVVLHLGPAMPTFLTEHPTYIDA